MNCELRLFCAPRTFLAFDGRPDGVVSTRLCEPKQTSQHLSLSGDLVTAVLPRPTFLNATGWRVLFMA